MSRELAGRMTGLVTQGEDRVICVQVEDNGVQRMVHVALTPWQAAALSDQDVVGQGGPAVSDQPHRDPKDWGHWEGDVFVFNEPVEFGPGQVVTRLDTSQMVVEDGVTRDDVIHALLNPIYPAP